MTLTEFKAWMDGFVTGVGDTPTKEQWLLIQEKINDVRETHYIPNPPILPSIPGGDVWCGKQNNGWQYDPRNPGHTHLGVSPDRVLTTSP